MLVSNQINRMFVKLLKILIILLKIAIIKEVLKNFKIHWNK